MLQGLSIPLVAKVCAALAVTTGASVATYEIVVDTEPAAVEETVLAEGSSSAVAQQEGPEALAFGDKTEEHAAEVASAEQEAAERLEAEKKEAEEREKHEAEEKEEREKKEAEAKREAEEREKKEAEEREKKEAEERDDVAPEIVILHPENDSDHDEAVVVFEGETEPGAIVKAGIYEADVDEHGAWRIELILSPGANQAVIKSYDAAGNVGEAAVTVHLVVEEEPPAKEEKEAPEEVEFSANQKWGSCDDVVPYDIFWGTATPNTVVHIVSEFGGAEVEVGDFGHWEKKVYFENAPRGDAFLVVVEAENGRQVFEFIATELPEEEPEGEGEG
ncbi:MAG: hypothetical protein ACR2P0_05855, partial [Acidimicrobiales bacterium]